MHTGVHAGVQIVLEEKLRDWPGATKLFIGFMVWFRTALWYRQRCETDGTQQASGNTQCQLTGTKSISCQHLLSTCCPVFF
jgi:hypothetical protein